MYKLFFYRLLFVDSKMLSPEELSSLAQLIIRVMNGLLSANTKHSLKQLNVQVTIQSKYSL